jgi:hypothetical protein
MRQRLLHATSGERATPSCSSLSIFVHSSDKAGLLGVHGLISHLALASLVLAHLLQLSGISLLARLADDTYPVESGLLAVLDVILHHEDDQTRDVLELHEAQLDLGGAGVRVPVALSKGDLLCSDDVLGVVEAEYLSAVCVDLDLGRSCGCFAVVRGGREGCDM